MSSPATQPIPERDSFAVRAAMYQMAALIARRRWIVVLTAVCAVALVVGYAWFRPPEYQAEVTVLAEGEIDTQRQGFYEGWNVFRKDQLATEAELIASGPAARETLEVLGLSYDDVYHPLARQLAHVWQTCWIGDRYRALKQTLFPKEETKWDLTREERDRVDAILDFRSGVSVQPIGDTNLARVVVRGPTKRVGEVANTLIDTYLRQRDERHRDEAQAATAALEEQLATVGAQLADIEKRTQEGYERNGVLFDFEKEKKDLEEWSSIEGVIALTRGKLANAESRLRETETQLAAEQPEQTTTRSFQLDAAREKLRGQLADYRIQLVEAQRRYLPDAPELRELQQKITGIEAEIGGSQEMVLSSEALGLNETREGLRKIQHELLADTSGTRAELAELERARDAYAAKFGTWAQKQREVRELLRELDAKTREHKLITEKLAQAKASAAAVAVAMPTLRVIARAEPPMGVSWPDLRVLVPAGFLLGLLAGICVAWIVEALENRVRGYHLAGGRGGARFYAALRSHPRDGLRLGPLADGGVPPGADARARRSIG